MEITTQTSASVKQTSLGEPQKEKAIQEEKLRLNILFHFMRVIYATLIIIFGGYLSFLLKCVIET